MWSSTELRDQLDVRGSDLQELGVKAGMLGTGNPAEPGHTHSFFLG